MAECIACKSDYTPGGPCPRCGTDNRPWEQWRRDRRGRRGWVDFMSPGWYLPILLTILILPVGIAGVWALWRIKQLVWSWSVPLLVVLTFFCILIVTGTYEGRDRLRESELLNQVRRGPARFFGAQFRIAAALISAVIATLAWTIVILSRPAIGGLNYFWYLLITVESQGLFSAATLETVIGILTLGGPLSIAAVGYVSLALASVYSASVSLAVGYAYRMNQQVPLPIFLSPVRLVRLVRSEAEQECSSLGPGLVWEGMERTRDGGVKLTARYRLDRKVLEDLAGEKTDLPMHTKCEVLADPWGRIHRITPKSELQV